MHLEVPQERQAVEGRKDFGMEFEFEVAHAANLQHTRTLANEFLDLVTGEFDLA